MDNGLLSKGGTILFDNALFYGQVYSEDRSKDKTPNGCGVRECEDFIREDPRVHRVNEISWRDLRTCCMLVYVMMGGALFCGSWLIGSSQG